jgi:RHS repeat-associated protein
MTNDGTRAYGWDARNRLTGVYGIPSESSYDPAGRRIFGFVGGTGTSFLYDGDNVVEEIQGGSPSATMMTGLGLDQRFSRTSGSSTSTYLTDNLGSTVALANSSGTIQTSYAYDPYGVTSTSGAVNTNPYQYTGRENNATGLYYYRARYYNPAWGRFISEDPIGLSGGANLYRYVSCNPIGHGDPLGTGGSSGNPGGGTSSPPTSDSGPGGGPNGNANNGPNNPVPNNPNKGGQCSSLVTGVGNLLRVAGHVVNIGSTAVLSVGVGIGVLGAFETGGASFGVTVGFGTVAVGGYNLANGLDAVGAFVQSAGTGDRSYANEVIDQTEMEAQNVGNAGPAAPVVDVGQTIADGLQGTFSGPPMASCP